MSKMVQKGAQKAKAKTTGRKVKPETSTKKGNKSTKEPVLSNGYSDTESTENGSEAKGDAENKQENIATSKETGTVEQEHPETPVEINVIKDATETNVESAEGETMDVNVAGTEENPKKTELDTVTTKAVKTVKSRKRKLESTTKEEDSQKKSTVVKSKAKKQKVLLSIPPARSIPGKVFVIGENDVGQLGLGEDVEVKKRPALLELPRSIIDIAAGGMHSVCLTENGEVITFGCNDEGALGRLTTEEGSEFLPRKVDIPEHVIQISAGDSHSAALTDSGQVYIWGNFRSGDGPMGLTPDGAKQVKPIKILNNVKIVKIASGNEHLVCLSEEGIVYTCGCGETGQLGRISERTCQSGGRKGRTTLLEPGVVPVTISGKPVFIDEIWTGSYSTFVRAQDSGLIYAFGLNNYNHLGFQNERVSFHPKQVKSFNKKSWLQISGGQHHTLALENTGLVYSLGRKDYGRLGLGENTDEKSEPTVIPDLQNEKCVNISCGNCVSFSVTEPGSVFSWGMGTNHQLGHGNDEDCHVPHRIEGNFLNSWKALKISGGGQHTLILACARESANQK